MTNKEAQNLLSRINQEGFHYCFIHYSEFENIKDKQFHKLRSKYISASHGLLKYIQDERNKCNYDE